MPYRNLDQEVIADFGREWDAYDQVDLPDQEWRKLFDDYFSLFHFDQTAVGFDLGCGSGRWARLVAPRVAKLHCIDPAEAALAVARRNLAGQENVQFHHASSDSIPLEDGSQDFGYSLGVLHHIPDTEAAMRDCVAKLKPGGQFLVYLYYRFDDRPTWFRALWKASDIVRQKICKLPFRVKKGVTSLIAATVYYPLARGAWLAEKAGLPNRNFPLRDYRNLSFYTMRTDALDRFGTRLEHRFTKPEIEAMMRRCGLIDIRFSDRAPYWVAIGTKS